MSARTRAQVDTNQPDESCSLRDDGTVERTRLNPARPWQSLEIDTLRWRWQAAASQSNNLPPFEELALDSLAGWQTMSRFCKWTKPCRGGFLKSWIGRPAHNLKVADLSIDRARALQDLFAEVVNESQPVQSVAHGLLNGSVCAYDLVLRFNQFERI